MIKINVGKEFAERLLNRDKNQRDGRNNAEDFRKKYLSDLDKKDSWNNETPYIELDFADVTRIGPSWANEAFAYFTKWAKPETILNKIKIIHITKVKKAIIDVELKTGYKEK